MTVAQWLLETMKKLGKAGVDAPRRDALVLLEDTLQKDRAWVLAHPEHELNEQELTEVNKLVERRTQREPLAYIRGRGWFYGRFFEITPDVLIPRPESEAFIELLKELVEDGRWKMDKARIAEIGTGSGCLAITAKLEFPNFEVVATDIDAKAVKIAEKNAKNHKVDVTFLKGSFFEPFPPSTFHLPSSILMANLPYVPDKLVTSPEIEQEPATALFSGTDGLDHYRELWAQIEALKTKPKYILTESLESQHKELENIVKNAGYKLQKTETLVQLFIPR